MNVELFRWINSDIKNPFLDAVLPVLSDKDYVVIPGLVALGLALYFGKRRARVCVIALLAAMAAADLGSEKFLKNLFAKERPYKTLAHVHVHRGGEWKVYDPLFDTRQSNSFPSTHAANVAALTVVLALTYRRSWWGMLSIALLVGLSRVYTGNHYPGDVAAGYVWGGLCGLAAAYAFPWLVRRVWGKEPPVETETQAIPAERRTFFWLLGLWTLLNCGYLFISPFDLAGDEAQYWDWSRQLALGYYSKPPMIAYFDGILVGAGGNKEWALRSGALLLTAGGVALLYALTLRIAKNERAALIAAIAALAMPATWAGSILMTIDPLLLFFWAAAMYTFHCAVSQTSRPHPLAIHGDPRVAGRDAGGPRHMWWWTGLALGLGMLSKYTMLFLYVSFALYLLLYGRSHLRTRGPYIALLVSICCMAGVVYWNWANDWVSVLHTVSIGAESKKSLGRAVSQFAEYFGAQAGLVSPILFGALAWALWSCGRRFRTNPDAAYLFLCGMVLFGFYALVALTRPPQANWPVCAYIAAAAAFGWLWTERPRSSALRKTLVAGVALGCVCGLALRATGLVYARGCDALVADARPDRLHLFGWSIDPDKDPTNRLRGARELGTALSKYTFGAKNHGPFIFSDRYQLTALTAFYTKGRPRTYCMNTGERRYNQYDLWGGWDKLAGRDGLFVTGGDEARARLYIAGMVQAGAFQSGEYLETVKVWRGKTLIKTYTISRMRGYTGLIWNPAANKY